MSSSFHCGILLVILPAQGCVKTPGAHIVCMSNLVEIETDFNRQQHGPSPRLCKSTASWKNSIDTQFKRDIIVALGQKSHGPG
ncbi:hypothetical protein QBC41DRAFT_327967 [Cercophora samala]|uniref:Secreted protein n=1 Tax=Cercophora samala TaxID=330535 RepID=A0AA40D9K9_9PEZI|nr:hypothetical protein QBC41DRAFT_327967 [Cercophora samala]